MMSQVEQAAEANGIQPREVADNIQRAAQGQR